MNQEDQAHFIRCKDVFVTHLYNISSKKLPKENIENIMNMCFEASLKNYKRHHNNQEIPSELLLEGDSTQEYSMMYVFNGMLEMLHSQIDLGVTEESIAENPPKTFN